MTFGKYELLDRIGTGSVAEVFKAKSFGAEGFEKLLAVKRILKKYSENESFVARFVADTEQAVLLSHANIAQVFDLGKVEDCYFMAMELVQGVSLATLIKECRLSGRQIPVTLAAFIASEISKGLDFAHRKRGRDLQPLHIVHMDLSAYNILISNEGEVKITDFGIARAKETLSSRVSGESKRRAFYGSPELISGEAPDKRSDIYTVGLLLCEMIALSHPLEGVREKRVLKQLEELDPSRIVGRRRDDALTAELIGIIEKCLAYDPAGRYQDAGDLYESLIAYLYNTGKRVGAHALSELLEEVLTEETSVSQFKVIEKESLAEAFRTSLIPKAFRRKKESPATEVVRRDATGPIVIVQPEEVADDAQSTELREIAILAIHSPAGAYLTNNVDYFQEMVENTGGSVVLSDEHDLVIGFGLDLPCGRELEEAMDAAFKLRRAAAIPNATKDAGLGVCVWPAKVSFSKAGTVVQDEIYLEAISMASEAASYGKNCVLTSSEGREMTGSTYQFDEHPVGFPEENALPLYQVSVRLFQPSEGYGRLFGRHQELQTLGSVFASVSNGKGGFLLLTGEPGIGKTRVVNEGQWRLMSSGGDVGWFETACVRWNRMVPFSSIAGIFRAIIAAEEVESALALREKVGRLRELALTAEEVDAVGTLLGLSIAGQDEDESQQGKLLYSATVHAASSLAADRMVVLVFENAEHMDGASREVLDRLDHYLLETPLLVLMTFHEPSEAEWMTQSTYQKIELEPLSRSDATRLAMSRLDATEVPPPLINQIIKISEGNPLFLEQYVWALGFHKYVSLKNGKATWNSRLDFADLPATLQELMAFRIAQLPDDHLKLLRHAAVLGQRFNIKLLGEMLQTKPAQLRPTLMALKEDRLVTRGSANEFSFSTGLLRGTVLASMPSEERGKLHLVAGQALKRLLPHEGSAFPGRLGVHYQEGGDIESAVACFLAAGEKAAREQIYRGALDFYIEALELVRHTLGADPDRILSICIPLGELAIKSTAYAVGLDNIQIVEALADKVTDKRTMVKALLLIAELHAHCRHTVEVDWNMQGAMKISSRINDPALSFKVQSTAGYIYFLMGDMKRAAPCFRKAIVFASREKDKEPLVACLSQLSEVEASAEEMDHAMATLSKAEMLVGADSSPSTRCKLAQSRGRVYSMGGNTDKAIASHLTSLEIAKEHGLKEHMAHTAHMAGELYLETGDNTRAFTYLTMSKSLAEEMGMMPLVKSNELLLSYIDIVEFDNRAGVNTLEEMLAQALERDAVWEQLHLLFYLSKIYMEKGKHAVAEAYLSQLIDVGGKVHNRLYHKKAKALLQEIKAIGRIAP